MTTSKLHHGELLCTIHPSFKFGRDHLCSGGPRDWGSAAPAHRSVITSVHLPLEGTDMSTPFLACSCILPGVIDG
jgi:hypothetical protein